VTAPNPTLTHLEYCTYCPKMCRHACPVSTTTGEETVIPQAKMATLNYVRKGQLGWSRASTAPIWACTGCRQCTSYCAHGVEPGATLFAGRAEAVKRGAGHPALERYPERFRAREARLAARARETLPAARFAEEAQVGWWPGCDAIDKGDADTRAALAFLDRVGESRVRLVAAERSCGGYPLYAAGHLDDFRWQAERVAHELARYHTVVLGCSACVYTLRTLYPAEGVRVGAQVLHTTEYLAGLVERIAEPAARPVVWYHDPCYNARYLGLVEEPRRILARVATVRDFTWSGKDTECCGGGGVLPKTMPAVADAMARRRLREVADAGGGAQTVVTSCGTCKRMLARVAPEGVVVRDLVELLEELTRAQEPAG
jgi:Fe-S oxidoreductase